MQQICLAEELKKPFVLHLRNGNDGSGDNDAYRAAFRLLEQHGSTSYKGVMHCFSGTAEDARKAVDMGFLLGVGGVVTYKKNTLKDIVQELPLENIVLETDAPYLAPVPYRGRRNESAYVSIVADKIAEIKGCDVALVAETTTQNALQLFSNLTP